jgi:hypothetical protein
VLKFPTSSADVDAGRIRVELVDPRTGAPLRVTDASGKAITAKVTIGRDDKAAP